MLTKTISYLLFAVQSTEATAEQDKDSILKYFDEEHGFDLEAFEEEFYIGKHPKYYKPDESFKDSVISKLIERVTASEYETPSPALKFFFADSDLQTHFLLNYSGNIDKDVFEKTGELFLNEYKKRKNLIKTKEELEYNNKFEPCFLHLFGKVKTHVDPKKNFAEYKNVLGNLIQEYGENEKKFKWCEIGYIKANYQLALFCYNIYVSSLYGCFSDPENLITYLSFRTPYPLFFAMVSKLFEKKDFRGLFILFCFMKVNMEIHNVNYGGFTDFPIFINFFSKAYPSKEYRQENNLSNLNVIIEYIENNEILKGKVVFSATDFVLQNCLTASNIIYFLKNSVKDGKIGENRRLINSNCISNRIVEVFERLLEERSVFSNFFSTKQYFSGDGFIDSMNVCKNLAFIEDIMTVFDISDAVSRAKGLNIICLPQNANIYKEYLEKIKPFCYSQYTFTNNFDKLHFLALFRRVFLSSTVESQISSKKYTNQVAKILSKSNGALIANENLRKVLKKSCLKTRLIANWVLNLRQSVIGFDEHLELIPTP